MLCLHGTYEKVLPHWVISRIHLNALILRSHIKLQKKHLLHYWWCFLLRCKKIKSATPFILRLLRMFTEINLFVFIQLNEFIRNLLKMHKALWFLINIKARNPFVGFHDSSTACTIILYKTSFRVDECGRVQWRGMKGNYCANSFQ